MSRHHETLEVEDHRAVWIADLARAFPEGDSVVGRFSMLSKTSFDPHSVFPPAFSPRIELVKLERFDHLVINIWLSASMDSTISATGWGWAVQIFRSFHACPLPLNHKSRSDPPNTTRG